MKRAHYGLYHNGRYPSQVLNTNGRWTETAMHAFAPIQKGGDKNLETLESSATNKVETRSGAFPAGGIMGESDWTQC